MKTVCTRCFKSLGVGSRAKIYDYVKSSRVANVTEVTSHIKLRQPTVSYHLKEMAELGLLCRRRNGRRVVFSINSICPHTKIKCIVA